MGNNELTCSQTLELIGAYLDDELPVETRRRVETHLLGCQTCAYEAQSLRITLARLKGDVSEVIASDALRSRTLRALYADNNHLHAEPDTAPVESSQFILPIRF